MGEMQLGLYEKAMPAELSWETKLDAAREAGFDFLEMSVDETDQKLNRLCWTQARREAVCRAMRECGLPIRSICLSGHRRYPLGSPEEAVRARSLEIFDGAVELACDLGVRIIQLAGYDVYYQQGDEQTRGLFLENLRRCTRRAAAYGVLLGFETMETPFMDTVGKAMEYVRAVGSPYLGVYPDLGNLTNAAKLYGFDPRDDLEMGRGSLIAMHIKETLPGQYRDLDFGAGHVLFAEGIAKARELGVCRFVTEFWHDGRENWRQRLAEVNRFARERMD